ncbi:MAG: aspartate aminotransferase [Opitutaceae bacterium]|nr:aspartate aminotransferase [Opitutaceae bacterium]
MYLTNAVQQLGTESAFKVLAKAKQLESQGKDIVHLEIGQPDFPTPENICAVGKQAIDDGFTSYGPTCGHPDFRDIIAEHISRTRDIDVKGSQVVVTPGAKPVVFYAILSVVEPGDEVVYPDPGFPVYKSLIDYIGGKGVPLPLAEKNDFSFEIDELEARVNDKTKLLFLNSPQNPTGGILKKEDLEAIAAICDKHDVLILADEIYSELIYDDDFQSVTQFEGAKDRTVLLDGFSKTYSMTGWRLGYGVFPEWMVESVELLMVNSNSCTASFSQRAGIEALTGPQDSVVQMLQAFRNRRDFFIEGLNKIPGISCRVPKGAFYAFANVSDIPLHSKELEGRLLDEAGVACLAGDGFGEFGQGFLRFSYANSIENIGEALDRIERFLSKL